MTTAIIAGARIAVATAKEHIHVKAAPSLFQTASTNITDAIGAKAKPSKSS